MKRSRILVFDDDPRRSDRWSEQLDRVAGALGFQTVPLAREDFEREFAALEDRRRRARTDAGLPADWGKLEFDRADIALIDFDLLELKTDTYTTGEQTAYLARCYSKCGLFLSVNRYGLNAFDLTLKGHPESYADLNVGSAQIANPRLWTGARESFSPWAWPVLPAALKAHRRRTKALAGALDKAVSNHTGIADSMLPRNALEYLGQPPSKLSVRDFVLTSGQGLQLKDKPLGDEQIARIASARLWKWVERLILPGQDVIVDAPHLAARYPSLLAGEVGKRTDWDRLAELSVLIQDLGVRERTIRRHRYAAGDWVSRPVWLWASLSNDEKISEVRDPWSAMDAPFLFCEDISRFLPRGATREFLADLESPYASRFVVDPSGSVSRTIAKAIADVDYRPPTRLVL